MTDTTNSDSQFRIEVAGNATEDEVAAMSAAVQLLWPVESTQKSLPVTSAWRYSGRHWGGPKPTWRLSNRV
ncbi:MAG: hypothetical protein ACC652_03610 [Acidimicrobiales bacterium]